MSIGNKKISELTEYVTPVAGDYLAVVDTANGETKKIDFINFKGDAGTDGTDGTDGASIIEAEFSGDDILFTKDDSTTVTLEDAKVELKGDTGATGANGVGAVIKLTTATAAATAAKTATLEGYTPAIGDVIALTLTNGNTAASMTLNINGGGAVAIQVGGLEASALTGAVTAGGTILLYYTGTTFAMTGATRDTNTNTTYSEISEAEIAAGTSSTARTISGRRAAYILGLAAPEGTAVKSTGEAGGTKFLREDGDGTCSWQTPSYPTRDSLGLDTDDTVAFANLSGTNTGDEPDASTTVKGIVELAIASEVNTGTSTTLAVTPDALAGSVMGTKGFCVIAVAPTTDVSAADGKAYIMIPECMNGMNLVRANASVVTAGTTNATTIDIYNVTDSQDMLSTAISIASAGKVGTAGTVNASYDDVATNDVLRIDVTSASTTNAKGLQVILEFMLA